MFAVGVLEGRTTSATEGELVVRLRLFCPFVGTAGALDDDTDDIIDEGVEVDSG